MTEIKQVFEKWTVSKVNSDHITDKINVKVKSPACVSNFSDND